jgi:hypothetical protein
MICVALIGYLSYVQQCEGYSLASRLNLDVLQF